MPAGDERDRAGDDRWQEFCRRLDELQAGLVQLNQLNDLVAAIQELSGLVYGLHELGQMVLLALKEAAKAGPRSSLLDLVDQVIEAFRLQRGRGPGAAD